MLRVAQKVQRVEKNSYVLHFLYNSYHFLHNALLLIATRCTKKCNAYFFLRVALFVQRATFLVLRVANYLCTMR